MEEDKRKIMGTAIGILGFIAVMAGLTYAIYVFNIANSDITGENECIKINYTEGAAINASELDFVSKHDDSLAKTTIKFYQDPSCGNNVGTIYIHTGTSTSDSLITGITDGNGITHGVLKYTIEKRIGPNGISDVVSETYTGYITNKENTENTGDTAIEVGKLESTETTYTVYLWLEEDSSGTITNKEISEATYSGYIHASARLTSTYTK